MNLRSLTLVACVLLLCIASGCSPSANQNSSTNSGPNSGTETGKQISSVNVVSVKVEPLEISAGKTGETTIRLNIQQGYHVNANPPTYPYLKPTELDIPSSQGLSVSFIVYPNPLKKKFQFAEQPLAVYEGETPLKISFKADPGAAKGDRHLSAKLRIQACDEQVCYAPGAIDLSLPVSVK